MQQFGRSHRSNQLYPPHYVLLLTDHPGEQRFAAAVARRLTQLGALTKGDRRGCCDGFDVSKFGDVTGKWGDSGVEEMHLAFVQEKPPNGTRAAPHLGLLGLGVG